MRPRRLLMASSGSCGAEAGGELLQRQIDRGAGDAAIVEIGPGAQGALARSHAHVPGRQIDIGLQARDIDLGEIGEELTAPVVPGCGTRAALGHGRKIEQGLTQATPQAQALAPLGRGRGVEAELVAARGVAHHQVQLAQGQRGLLAQVVGPAQGAVADHELGLREEPVGAAAVGLGGAGEIEPGDEDVVFGRAAHIERGRVDHQLLEAQAPQRAHRQGGVDLRQVQSLAASGVKKPHIAQLESGHEGGQPRAPGLASAALGFGADFTDLDGNPHRLGRPSFHGGAPVVDSRHNDQMNRAQGEREKAPDGHHHPQQQPRGHGECLGDSRGRGEGSRALIHILCKL